MCLSIGRPSVLDAEPQLLPVERSRAHDRAVPLGDRGQAALLVTAQRVPNAVGQRLFDHVGLFQEDPMGILLYGRVRH